MNALYPIVASRAGHRCEYCRAPEAAFNLRFEVEHVVPRNRGGASDGRNLALSCRSCNLFKSDAIVGIDPTTGEPGRLFDPRQDVWQDHFRTDRDFLIEGLTAVGRATTELLNMNSPSQLAARRQWGRLGLFP